MDVEDNFVICTFQMSTTILPLHCGLVRAVTASGEWSFIRLQVIDEVSKDERNPFQVRNCGRSFEGIWTVQKSVFVCERRFSAEGRFTHSEFLLYDLVSLLDSGSVPPIAVSALLTMPQVTLFLQDTRPLTVRVCHRQIVDIQSVPSFIVIDRLVNSLAGYFYL